MKEKKGSRNEKIRARGVGGGWEGGKKQENRIKDDEEEKLNK
jgi:hypothetical protein